MATPAKRDHGNVEISDSPGSEQTCKKMNEDLNSSIDSTEPKTPNAMLESTKQDSNDSLNQGNRDSVKLTTLDSKLDKLISTVDSMNTKLAKLDMVEEELGSLRACVQKLNDDGRSKQKEIDSLRARVNELAKYKEKVITLEAHSRRDNLLIDGLKPIANPETDQKCVDLVYNFLIGHLKIADARQRIKIVRAHRTGPTTRKSEL